MVVATHPALAFTWPLCLTFAAGVPIKVYVAAPPMVVLVWLIVLVYVESVVEVYWALVLKEEQAKVVGLKIGFKS